MKTRLPWLILGALMVLTACKQKKSSLSGNEPVKAADFIAAFPAITLPLQIADTNVQRLADTTVISQAVLSSFIPDSILKKYIGKQAASTVIRPVGRIEKADVTYLLTNFTQHKKNRLLALLFNKKKQYVTHLNLLNSNNTDGYYHYVSINREPTFILSREKINKDKTLLYTRNGFGYNEAAGSFIAVINESNENTQNSEVLNPIDTLGKKNKFSGDYVENKHNFISLRDGRNTSSYLFFIHFEKNDGQCTGELKGELSMRNATQAIFHENGDPCVIDFTVSKNDIKVKEQGSCGNHRGVRCQFNDTYRRKKEAVVKKTVKK